ncbi:MAG: Ig-like domain repeat protein, partial [Actinomycetales bacterium]
SGAPGARGLVYVTNGSDVVGIGTLTNGEGTVTLDKTALKPGTHELDVFFNGSDQFEPADVPVTVTVTKAATTTKAKVATTKIVASKTKAKVTATVSAQGFTPADGKVTVKKGTIVVGTGTVLDGVATVTLRPLTKVGTSAFTVSYAGNDLALASSGTVSIKVVKK